MMTIDRGGAARVITGTTGFLGSHLLARLVERGEHSWVLARGVNPGSRVRDAVAAARISAGASAEEATESLVGVEAVSADICVDGCGISTDDLARLREASCREFWHAASSLKFHDDNRREIHEHNVLGAANAVRLAEEIGCERFVYVSTAYVAGTKVGEISEELQDPGGSFNNYYERSKCLAEHVIVAHCEARGMEWKIVRPSIVIGPTSTFGSGGSKTGMYGFLRLLVALQPALQEAGRRVRFVCDMTTPFNLIPVDWVVDDLEWLIEEDFAGASVHHLTTENTIAVDYALSGLTEDLDVEGFEPVEDLPLDATELERAIAAGAVFYGSYLKNPKSFKRGSLPPRRGISEHECKRFAHTYLREIGALDSHLDSNVAKEVVPS